MAVCPLMRPIIIDAHCRWLWHVRPLWPLLARVGEAPGCREVKTRRPGARVEEDYEGSEPQGPPGCKCYVAHPRGHSVPSYEIYWPYLTPIQRSRDMGLVRPRRTGPVSRDKTEARNWPMGAIDPSGI